MKQKTNITMSEENNTTVAAAVSMEKLTHVAKPERSVLDKEVKELQTQIETSTARITEIRKEIDEMQSGRSDFTTKLNAAKTKFNELKDKKQQLIAQRNEINQKLKGNYQAITTLVI